MYIEGELWKTEFQETGNFNENLGTSFVFFFPKKLKVKHRRSTYESLDLEKLICK